MALTDTHCHLDFDRFDGDRDQVIERAAAAGVVRLLDPGIDLASSRKAVELSERYEQVYSAVGVHPNSGLTWKAGTLTDLEALAGHPKVAAVGEIGLDYYRDRAPRYVQEQVFRRQLDLAAALGLPVVLHNREATEDLLRALEAWHAELVEQGSPLARRPGVLHSYSGNMEQAQRAMQINFYIGITGPITFRNATDLRELVARLPLERLLVETDAPFLTPHPHRGERNEPGYVRMVAEEIAELHHVPLSEVASITAENAARLFKWKTLH